VRKKTEEALIEAATGFSQEESLAIAPHVGDEGMEGPDKGLFEVWRTTNSRVRKASSLSNVVNLNTGAVPHGERVEATVKEYTVRAEEPGPPDETRHAWAFCDCVDFAIRGRNEGMACKHVVAVMNLCFRGSHRKYLNVENK